MNVFLLLVVEKIPPSKEGSRIETGLKCWHWSFLASLKLLLLLYSSISFYPWNEVRGYAMVSKYTHEQNAIRLILFYPRPYKMQEITETYKKTIIKNLCPALISETQPNKIRT